MLGKGVPFTIVTHCDFAAPELCKCLCKQKLSVFVLVTHLQKTEKTLFLMSVTILTRADNDVCLKIEGEPPDMTSNPFTLDSGRIKRPQICVVNMTTQQIKWNNVPRTTTLWDFEVSTMTHRTPPGKSISVPYQPRPFSGRWIYRYKETQPLLEQIPDDVHCIFVYDLPPSDQIQEVTEFARQQAADIMSDIGETDAAVTRYEHSFVLWLSKDYSLLPVGRDVNYGPTLTWTQANEVFRYIWPISNPFSDVTPLVSLDGLRLCLSTWFGSHNCGEATGFVNRSVKIPGLQNPKEYAALTYHSSNVCDLSLPLTSGTIKFQLSRSTDNWCIVIVAKLSDHLTATKNEWTIPDATISPFINEINHISWLRTVVSTTNEFDPSIIYNMVKATKTPSSSVSAVLASDCAFKHIWNACIARGENIWRTEMMERRVIDLEVLQPPIEPRRTHSQLPAPMQ